MTESTYNPVPHDAVFRKALLTKPGVQKAFDALEQKYTALHRLVESHPAISHAQAKYPAHLKRD
jgi:hypothetical protein